MLPPSIASSEINEISLDFGPDKSQILRGLAIIFMIILHNDSLIEFKICVPIFTFLVGYGYAFAKEKNLKHGLKRSWNLLSHFWLILFVLFLPVAIWKGEYEPTISNVLLNMFGLESNLNWYSWYIYFYIFAMVVMIPISRLIDKFGITAIIVIIGLCIAVCCGVHTISNWDKDIWLKAIFDCCLCTPPMLTGYCAASTNLIKKLPIPFRVNKYLSVLGLLIVCIAIFFLRGIPYATYIDFITVPIFAFSIVIIFNLITWNSIHNFFIGLGKESMNMWFIHAIFATTCTAVVFAPLVDWIYPKIIHILVVIIASFCIGKLFTAMYAHIKE